MSFNPNGELSLLGTYDRGIPNQERIVFDVSPQTNLSQYIVLLGFRDPHSGAVFPYKDYLFWFGNISAEQLTKVFLYTGPGEFRNAFVQNTTIPAFVFHWGHPQTLFADTSVLPILVQIGGVALEPPPQNLPQLLLRGGS
jgi:hypothetical protein